jgi:hypothetical protein
MQPRLVRCRAFRLFQCRLRAARFRTQVGALDLSFDHVDILATAILRLRGALNAPASQRQGRDRGLVFWFGPETARIAKIPLDDRATILFVKGRSQDFQQVAVQGMLTWHVVDPAIIASRFDFRIGLFTGKLQGEPIEHIVNIPPAARPPRPRSFPPYQSR